MTEIEMVSGRLADVADFIERYRAFTQQQEQERFNRFCRDFDRLRCGLGELLAQAEIERRRTACTFNIFQLLGVAHDEVRTHSALLADLLDPRGSHAQGTLFLEHFLRRCAAALPGVPVPPIPLLPTGWTVRTELVTPQGNLDLVLSSARLGYLYVIENKINATEQAGQLARYSQWMQRQKQLYPHQALFYLTPEGRRSRTNRRAIYHRLSYRDHIIPWLANALPHIEAPRLVEVVKQYVDVLNAL